MRYPVQKEKPQNDGWTDWIGPPGNRHRLACCDCGLIHDMEFAVVDGEQVAFRAKRNNRATGQRRRKR